MNKQKLKQAFAGMDNINTFWVDKMSLPPNEKNLRVQMMNDFEQKIAEIPQNDAEKKSDKWLLMAGISALLYKQIYLNIVDTYFSRYVYEICGNKRISDFSQAWINNHAEEFQMYSHTSDTQTIVRTEVNAMCGIAQIDGYVQAGYTKKMWQTMADKRVRLTHKSVEGQTVLLEEPFVVGDSLMMFPCDTSLGATPKEVINCRCSMIPVK